MKPPPILPTRLRAAAPGLGQGSRTEVEERAAELAVSDGREKVSDTDLSLAAAELAGGGTTVKVAESNALSDSNEPPLQTGHLDDIALPDDQDNLAEQLIEAGLEEADHDIRLAAELERKTQR